MRRIVLLLMAVFAGALSVEQYVARQSPEPVGVGIPGQHSRAMAPFRLIDRSTLVQGEGETDIGYVRRISAMIHLGTYHCEPTDFRLSLIERALFLLFGRGDLDQGILVASRFSCGFCHQRAHLAKVVLSENGFASEVYGIFGHVILRAQIGGATYAVDPDYGVDPFAWPDSAPALADAVRKAYSSASWDNVERVVPLYTSIEDNGRYAADLDTYSAIQTRIFNAATYFGWAAAIFSAALIAAAIMPIRIR